MYVILKQTHYNENFDITLKDQQKFDEIVDTYVINLKSRSEKYKYISDQLNKQNLKFNMFDAIDGSKLDVNDLENKNIYNTNKTISYMDRVLRKGEIGCALSHIFIWAKMLNNTQSKYFLIFEDDAILINNFKSKLIDVLNDIENKEWDVLYLNENCYKHFGEMCDGKNFTDKTLLPNRIGYGMYGYVINKKFVEKIINNLLPIYYAIDVLLDEESLKNNLICIRSKEVLVHYNKNFHSDTQNII
jgi:GR25 family glycosyltransferase involved in LPS biosynthesis